LESSQHHEKLDSRSLATLDSGKRRGDNLLSLPFIKLPTENKSMKFARYLVLLSAALLTSNGFADDFTATEAKINAAMASDARTPEEVERDSNRLPLQTLQFFGLRDDMVIVELLPGGGWYTKILAPVVAENGEYYMALGTGRAKELLSQPGFEKGKVVAENAKISRPEGASGNIIEDGDLGVKNADMVLTFRNYHNFGAEGRAAMNKAAFDALKSGGTYAVVDHTRRHMEKDGPENGRRVDPVLAIKEIQAAGFMLVDFSTLHSIPDDELRYEVGRKTVTGNTDRWSLKFVKP
jgi:predicted methyltransferase